MIKLRKVEACHGEAGPVNARRDEVTRRAYPQQCAAIYGAMFIRRPCPQQCAAIYGAMFIRRPCPQQCAAIYGAMET
jgi:hypothetical protein